MPIANTATFCDKYNTKMQYKRNLPGFWDSGLSMTGSGELLPSFDT